MNCTGRLFITGCIRSYDDKTFQNNLYIYAILLHSFYEYLFSCEIFWIYIERVYFMLVVRNVQNHTNQGCNLYRNL